MSHAKYRAIFIALGLAFLAVVAGAWLFGSPEAPELILPPAIEQITPLPGSQVPSQTNVEVDVPVGYRIEMFIDNFRIPDGELRFVEGTGVYSWSPSTSQVIEWGPGLHTVIVRWRKIGGLPDEGEYTWTIRVY